MNRSEYKFIGMLLTGFVFSFIACKPDLDLSTINNLNNNDIGVFGHGGMGYSSALPTNSLSSIQKAIELGADGVEVDVQLTKDNVLILYHNERLEDATNGSGQVGGMTWEEIQGVKYNDWFKMGKPIITLEELLSTIDPKKTTLTLDCKVFEADNPTVRARFQNALVEIIEENNLSEHLFIELRDPNMLKELNEQQPNFRIFALGGFEQAFQLAKQLNLYGISVTDKHITTEQVKLAHDHNLKVAFYTSNRKQNIIEKNPDYIQTDKLRYFLKLLK